MTLGLSLNTRIVGMAVFNEETLVDYHIKLFKEGWSPQKLSRMAECIYRHITDYKIKKVACLLPSKHLRTAESKKLLQKLSHYCQKKNLPLHFFVLKDLRDLYGETKAKKKALMQALSLLYPELSLAQRKELMNRKKYYTKLFEAVGVATLLSKKITYEK